MTDTQLFNFIKDNIQKVNPELLNESTMLCGPLISLMAFDFYNKIKRDYFFIKDDFLKVDYNPNASSGLIQGYKTTVSKNDNQITFKVHEAENFKKSFINNRISFLEDWFINNEQIGVVLDKSKIIKTEEFDFFIEKRILDFGSTFHEKNTIEIFSWYNFFNKEKIQVKFNFQDVLENCYLLFKKGFIRDVSHYFPSWTNFYSNFLNEDELSPYFYVRKNCVKNNLFNNVLDNRNQDNQNCIKLEPNKGIIKTNLAMVIEELGEDEKYLYKKHKYWFGLYPLIELIKKSSKTISNNLIYALMLDLYEINDVFSKEKFNKQVSKKDITKALTFFGTMKSQNHQRVIIKMKEISINVDFYWMVEFISLLSNNENNAFYGFIENYNFDDLDLEEVTAEKLFNKIDYEFWKEQFKNKEEYISPVDLTNFHLIDYVKELTSNIDLKLEGENLNHCVGGYGRVLKNGESRIFSIKYKKKRSTVEFSISNGRIVMKQHYSYNNTKPHLYNRAIAKRLLNFLTELSSEIVFNHAKVKKNIQEDIITQLLHQGALGARENPIEHLDVHGRGLAEILRRFGRSF